MKPPSTARTAGRSDWAERRFRRQPFILLSFSSSKKLQKAQETQSYQRFQHIAHTVFNTSGTNGPTFAFTGEIEYTLGFTQRIAHRRSQGETWGISDGGGITTLGLVSHVSETLRGRGLERQTLPLLGLGWMCSPKTQKACGTAMRLCASLLRGVAAPLGCVIL